MSEPFNQDVGADLKLNPNFGSGVFRRRVRLEGLPHKVIAELEDCAHGFRCVLHHDGKKVTAIEPEALRGPLTTCKGAVAPINALVGIPLKMGARGISRRVNPRANCTHLYDLSILAVRHCLRGEVVRQWDVSVPDEKDGPTLACITLNGEPMLAWSVRKWFLQDEGELYGRSLGRGFFQWSSEIYEGDKLEAALVLQQGYLVSVGQQIDMDSIEGLSIMELTQMRGKCYAYSPERIDQAERVKNTIRDFTYTPEKLLKFE